VTGGVETLPPAVGTEAPDFTLPSTAGADVTLSGYRGTHHVLLAFFPAAFSSVCTAEMCAFSEDLSQYASADTVVLPISVDWIPALKVFKERERMTVDLLSDSKREVVRAYGVYLEPAFVAKRAYILIDKAGIVRWSHVESELGHRRDNSELLAQLSALG
jgi:peroxiredoxin